MPENLEHWIIGVLLIKLIHLLHDVHGLLVENAADPLRTTRMGFNATCAMFGTTL